MLSFRACYSIFKLAEERPTMTYRLLQTLIFTLASITFIACGGGGANDDMDHSAMADMDHSEDVAEDTGSSSEMAMEMIGGGHATLVHEGAGGSPHVSVHWAVNDANITISYGRPYLRDRVVGDSVPPMADAVWRLGADEATTLTADTDIMLGDSHIPAGEYTLWTAHMNDEFHLIVNSETGQWGTAYNADNDFAHIAMEVSELATPADQLVISIGDGQLGFDWGAMTASVPLMVH